MTEKDIKVIEQYIQTATKDKSSYEKAIYQPDKQLLQLLSEDITQPQIFNDWLKKACDSRHSDALEWEIYLGFIYDLFDINSSKVLQCISLEDWHSCTEDMISIFAIYPTEDINDTLYKMAMNHYPNQYYSDDDNGCIARKCIWTLWRRGAIDKIEKLSNSGDIITEGYAKHQLRKLDK